jgi:cytoskeletal protein CcmA (bactofilin family)
MAEPTTIIGEFTSVHGNLQGDEDLVVLGRVEGSIQLERTLVVETSGVLKADVSVRNAVVSGVVVGNVEAVESVQITAEGRMVGDIVAPRVIIVEGALFRGRVDMGESAPTPVERVQEEPEESTPAFTRRPAPRRAASARPTPARRTTRASRETEPEVEVEAEEPAAAPAPTRRRPTRAKKASKPADEAKAAKPKVKSKPKDKAEAPAPPPPKPRVAPKKRRVSVRKKR